MADPLWSLVAPLVAPLPLVWARQNAPRPAKPYATLAVNNGGRAPWLIEVGPDPDGNSRFIEHRTPTVEVQFYGDGAKGRADALAMRLRMPASVNRAAALGVGVTTVMPAMDLTALINETQYEDRAVLEFRAHVAAELSDAPGLIEHVAVEGDCVETIDAPGTQPVP